MHFIQSSNSSAKNDNSLVKILSYMDSYITLNSKHQLLYDLVFEGRDVYFTGREVFF